MSVGLVFDGVGADGEVSATRERIQVDPCRPSEGNVGFECVSPMIEL